MAPARNYPAGPEILRIQVLAALIAVGGLVYLLGLILFGAADKSDLKQFKRGA